MRHALLLLLFLTACAAPAPGVSALATATVPPTADPFVLLLGEGDAQAAMGARTAAEGSYRAAAALRPADPAPHLRLARLYLDWGAAGEGLAALEAARELGAAAAQVDALAADLYALQGDWEAVLASGQAALEANPGDVATRHRLALACLALERPADARIHYRAILALDPADALAHERLGILLTASETVTASEHLRAAATPLAADIAAALETAGDDPSYRLARVGQLCLAHGQPLFAVWALQEAVARSPAYADAQALLGQALAQAGRSEAALEHLEAAVRLAPDSALARSLLGLYHLQAGNPEAARPHLEAAYELQPENPYFCLDLAALYAGLGQYAAADIWLEEATRLAPQDAAVWEAVARFYLDRAMVEQGLGAAQTLVRLAPQSAMAHDLAGWGYFLAGRPADAEENLLRAVALDPTLAPAYFHLSQVYAYLGQDEQAQAAMQRAVDLGAYR